ncbi:MAG: membrane protein insertion efficiency factor YidD [Bacteroidia bacterium]
MIRIVLIFFFLISISSYAQLSKEQIQLINKVDFKDHRFDARTPKFLSTDKGILIKYNPVNLVLGSLLYIYQKVISPQLLSNCPYEISCSAFSKASIQEFGFIKGIPLTADRLTRCTQFTMMDILPSQINESNGKIIDNTDKYRLRKK